MPGLACYWLKAPATNAIEPLDQFLDTAEGDSRSVFGPLDGPGYRAKLFLTESPPHELPWAGFLRQGFGDQVRTPTASGAAGLLVIELSHKRTKRYFAFAFGFGGRHLLRSGVWQPGYGLRTALNLIYPKTAAEPDAGRLMAVDSKWRAGQTMRSRRQASQATTFDSFDLDRFKDVVGGATGTPADSESWGRRVTGGDAIYLRADITFDELPALCRRLIDAHDKTDYQRQFGWLDDVQPVADRDRVATLEQRVVSDLLSGDIDHLALSPPEIVDWTRVDSFCFHYDRRETHPDLRLDDYLRGLDPDKLKVESLKNHYIFALDGDGATVEKWSVWRCLQGEMEIDGQTVILDDGEFVDVSHNYLKELNDYIQGLREPAIQLPAATDGAVREAQYNADAARNLQGCVLLDKRVIRLAGQTPVEICDVLTDGHEFVHVKRELGSADLSHLFAQGQTSAALIQEEPEFRRRAREEIAAASGNNPAFDFIDPESARPSDFVVVYGVIARWRERSLAAALPFFSKVNLRSTARELQRRGFQVAFAQIRIATDRADGDAAARAKGRRPRLRRRRTYTRRDE